MLRDAILLLRPGVSLAVAAGTLFGMVYHTALAGTSLRSWLPVLSLAGSFLLCGGCSALNQMQEHARDALMERTENRPLPAGRLRLRHAALVAVFCIGVGLLLFGAAGGWMLFGLGVLVPLIYNGMYTPLKFRTSLALPVGAVAGALPPLTGWIAAGGAVDDPRILLVVGVFYLWQVPHFWHLAERHREQYLRAGFVLPRHVLMSRESVRQVVHVLWLASYAVALMVLLATVGGGYWAMLATGFVPMVVFGKGRLQWVADAALPVTLCVALLLVR